MKREERQSLHKWKFCLGEESPADQSRCTFQEPIIHLSTVLDALGRWRGMPSSWLCVVYVVVIGERKLKHSKRLARNIDHSLKVQEECESTNTFLTWLFWESRANFLSLETTIHSLKMDLGDFAWRALWRKSSPGLDGFFWTGFRRPPLHTEKANGSVAYLIKCFIRQTGPWELYATFYCLSRQLFLVV